MATIDKAIRFLIYTEPIWVLATLGAIYVSILLGINRVSWLMLVILLIPPVLNFIASGKLSRRTPFDIPILIFAVGIVMGILVSRDLVTSLGGVVSFAAMVLVYYTIVNYPYYNALPKWVLGLAIVTPVAVALVTLVWWDSFIGFFQCSGNLPLRPPSSVGAAWFFFTSWLIFLGVMIRDGRLSLRLPCTLISFGMFAATLLVTRPSLERLLASESIASRVPLWSATLDMIKENPFTGIGLGSWPVVYTDMFGAISSISPHNAYLDLYSNTGVFGLAAVIFAAVIIIRLTVGILRASYKPFWSGFGVSLGLFFVGVALLAVVEDGPFSIIVATTRGYNFVLSPLPLLAASLLVLTHQRLKEKDASSAK